MQIWFLCKVNFHGCTKQVNKFAKQGNSYRYSALILFQPRFQEFLQWHLIINISSFRTRLPVIYTPSFVIWMPTNTTAVKLKCLPIESMFHYRLRKYTKCCFLLKIISLPEFFLLENLVGKFVLIDLSSKSILTVYNRITYAMVEIK